MAFGVIGAGVATATDFNTGVIDRFRSLPVTRLRSSRPSDWSDPRADPGHGHRGGGGSFTRVAPAPEPLGRDRVVGLMLLGLFAFTWFGVLMGMIVKSSDAMQGIGFAIVFPLSFLAGTFVPIQTMKLVPRTIGEWDPLSALVAAVRQVTQGTQSSGSWQLVHPVISMVGWCVLVMAICVPLALRRFANAN